VWSHLGVHQAAALFTGGNRFDNNIAAMPSLHAAYPMLICLFFWSRANRWFRALLVAYVLAMAFTLVYAGEHFVLDELVGWTYAIVVFVVGSRLLHRWEARRGRPRADHDARNGDTRAEALHAPLTRATAATND
jgi:membrane-associated phospholipid phosphatase